VPDHNFELPKGQTRVSRESLDRLSRYYDLLLKWQSKINLIGPDTVKNAWERHFLDSLQLLDLIPDLSQKIVDLGSGAGFAGMVLAICGAADVHLIESDGKKIIFLKEVARITKTKVGILHRRIEDYPLKATDILVSRACAELDALLALAFPYASHETICLFHKGKNWAKEIEVAEKHWQFNYAVVPSAIDQQGVILKLTNIGKRGYDGREQGE
jgi:16S rRNA (guanine527-N7)-methyltransferase